MDRHVCALLQLFGGVPLIQDADIPSHTYALCFPAASAAVRFSMALQVSLLYGTWDNDVLENSVRPYYSRSGQLLAGVPPWRAWSSPWTKTTAKTSATCAGRWTTTTRGASPKRGTWGCA